MPSRRQFLQLTGAGLMLASSWPRLLLSAPESGPLHHKPIPASGEQLPVIGMGTWLTFNVGKDPVLRERRSAVLEAFLQQGGGMIDCSPMYGSSADMLGYGLQQLGKPEGLFAADKVWTRDGDETRSQTLSQARRWGVQQMDLMQVHNLLNWQAHLPRLAELKQEGLIRYLGITTSHGRRHDELEQIMAKVDLDFVQLSYNLRHRQAEQRLLPLARERGIAVIANRPYDGGPLIRSLQRRQSLPDWIRNEYGYQTWADMLLGFVVSHPAITCAIPATTKVEHLRENMTAGTRALPNEPQRQRLIKFIESF